MHKHSSRRTARLLGGLTLALLTLAACAGTPAAGERESLDRYERHVIGHVGGA